MKVKKFSKGLMITVGLGAVLLATSAYASTCEAPAPGTIARFGASAQLTNSGEVVMEWNQQAVALTLLPAFNLAPVQQARVMAIVQVAVHDAVNGITGDYETYLSPGPAPENSSPEAAAIAAAHHALKNLFQLSPTQAASLEASYTDSLAAHGLSPVDPGIACQR